MWMNKNEHTFIGFDSSFDEADIVVFGAPFDGTTSFRPGTRFAPNVMRMESDGLETYSPYLDKDLEEIKVFDAGDLTLPFGDTNQVLKTIETFTKDLLLEDKLPIMIGGEHLISYAAIKAVYEQYPDLRILHFDAHTDLRESYMGVKLSHACVMKRVWDLVGDGRIYQFGIRSGEKSEFEWAKQHTYLHKFNCHSLKEYLTSLDQYPLYVTIDLDILDPSIFPGTGTPEAGGISFQEMLSVIEELQPLTIVGADLVELCPHYDSSGVSTAVACKTLRELVLAL